MNRYIRYSFGVFKQSGLTTLRRQTAEQQHYSNVIESMIKGQISNTELRENVMAIRQEIKEVVSAAYSYPIVEQVLAQVGSAELCRAAVEQYVGSITSPKNDAVKEKFLLFAQRNAKTESERQMVQYYNSYLSKLDAMQSGNTKQFEKFNESLLTLAEHGHLASKHLIAKELYLLTHSVTKPKERQQMNQQAYRLFRECVSHEFPHSFYHIGEMAERGDIDGQKDLDFAYECYLIAASFENPKAYFKLSQFHKEGIAEKNPALEFLYIKRAAELGLVDAMHNLAVMYQPQDEIKALAWFVHAANQEFIPSMYNVAMIFYSGTRDGFVLPSRPSALQWLQKIQAKKDDRYDVSKEINAINEEMKS